MTTAKNRTGKTHWLRNTLLVLVVCGVIGLIWAAVQFNAAKDPLYAYATLELTFDGAAKGVAPNGYEYTVSDLTSDEVLEEAIAASGLNVTAEEVRANLTLTGSWPEDMVSQALSYESLLDFSVNRQVSLEDFHPTLFSVTLSDGFSPALSQAELSALLERVLSVYRDRFIQRYSYGAALADVTFTLSDYDYAQQLTILRQRYEAAVTYAQELYNQEASFRLGGRGFNDIAVQLNSLMDSEVSRLNAEITMNALTRNTVRLINQYQFEIRDLTNQLARRKDQLAKLDALIAAYDKNEIIYLSTTDSLTKIDGNSSATYDALVARRKALADDMTELNSEVQDYQLKLADLTAASTTSEAAAETEQEATSAEEGTEQTAAPAMTAEEIQALAAAAQEAAQAQLAALEKNIEALEQKGDAILTEFASMITAYNQEQLNEGTVSISATRTKAPSLLSGAYISRAIKTAGPLCALGFMVCLIGLIISRKKEG